MQKKRLLVLSPLPEMVVTGLFTMKAGAQAAEELSTVTFPREGDREQLLKAVGGADLILGDYTMNIGLDAEAMKAAVRCLLVQQPSAGYQHIDVDAALENGVPVANVASANSVAVAEHTIMAVLACLKKLILAHDKTSRAEWAQDEMATYGVYELAGRTFGIVGMGRIGREVASRARVFGCDLLYYDVARLSEEEEAELGVSYRDIDELVAASDVITLHTPLTPETEGLINAERIGLVRQNAVLVNVARGGVVDEAAVAAALEEGKLAGAAFDVFTTEPVSPDNPLLNAPNVILTPHIAGATNEARMRIIDLAIGNIARAISGQRPECLLDDVRWPRETGASGA